MAINPLVDQGHGRFKHLGRHKNASIIRFKQKTNGNVEMHFARYKKKNDRARFYVDDGDGRFDPSKDQLIGKGSKISGATSPRSGRFTVETLRVEDPIENNDMPVGWVGPGTLIGYETTIMMADDFSLSYLSDTGDHQFAHGWCL
tara:strand:+ start:1583 stop:2017 length:435 start_codon:yes stop_codon:yes gene_type:complete